MGAQVLLLAAFVYAATAMRSISGLAVVCALTGLGVSLQLDVGKLHRLTPREVRHGLHCRALNDPHRLGPIALRPQLGACTNSTSLNALRSRVIHRAR